MTILVRENASVSNVSRPSSTPSEGTRIGLILVDDDDDYREAAASELDYLGFDVVALPSGEALIEGLAEHDAAEIIVLDWRLPSGLGIDWLRRLRERGCFLPVIFLTGVPATAYENAALDGGAVDFVDKARGMTILAKRLRASVALARRLEPATPRTALACGALTLKARSSSALWRGADPGLTVTEFNIVHLLASRAGEYVTYRAIYDCVHHAGFVAGDGMEGYRTNVRSSIKRIRNKFRALDADFHEIENFAAFGYRWRSGAAHAL